jgi:hypothetical protein
MPYNMTPVTITNVMPKSLCLSFTENYIYPLLATMYNGGTFERSLITDGGANTPRYLRTFTMTKRLTTAQLTTLLNFWEATVHGGLIPFYFYNPFDVCPAGSNWDATGTQTNGRVPVFFRGNWGQRTDLSRHMGPNLVLVETADLVAEPHR